MSEYFEQDLQEAYREDTSGRRWHVPITTPQQPAMKGKNGEVETTTLSHPMQYEEFKKLTDEQKRFYIESLKKRFDVADSHISKMLGIHPNYFSKIKIGLGMEKINGRSKRTRGAALEKWAQFVNSASPFPIYPDAPPVTDCSPEDPAPKLSRETTIEQPHTSPVTYCNFEQFGTLNAAEVASRINAFVPDGTKCRVEVKIYPYGQIRMEDEFND